MIRRLYESVFLRPWEQVDAEAAAFRAQAKAEGRGYHKGALVAFLWGAVCLTLMEYFGDYRAYRPLVEDLAQTSAFWASFRDGPWWQLSNHAWWALWRVFGFFVLPCIAIKLSGAKIRDQFLSIGELKEDAKLYVVGFLIVFPFLIGAFFEPHFQSYYPFYRTAHRSWADLLTWELLYAAQFFSLEFFFRGWWLQEGRKVLGSGAVLAMVIPYVMIHFGKPFPETLGAIAAGVFLGTMALRSKSIWGGVAVHVTVAVSMDLAALVTSGRGLPGSFWP